MTRRRKKAEQSKPEFHLETLKKRILFFANSALTVLDVLTEEAHDG